MQKNLILFRITNYLSLIIHFVLSITNIDRHSKTIANNNNMIHNIFKKSFKVILNSEKFIQFCYLQQILKISFFIEISL